MKFPDYSLRHDLHFTSRRGLTNHLIPQWLSAGLPLDDRIESTAYGETPTTLLCETMELLSLSADDLILDLGAGAGNIVALFQETGFRAWGVERNPALVQAGHNYLAALGLPLESLVEGDFLSLPWPSDGTKAFAASARFGQETLAALAQKIDRHPNLRAIGLLGRNIALPPPWLGQDHGIRVVRWNHDELERNESLYTWIRSNSSEVQAR